MHDDLQKFFAHPGPRNYLRVRERLLSRRRGRPQPHQYAELVAHFAAGEFAQLRSDIDAMMPAWALSPAVYWLGASAALEIGDTEAAELDRFLYQCCLRGIMATGDGTAERPFHITYSSDIEEVLFRMSLARIGSRVARGKRGLCDVACCEGGAEIWFLLEGGVRELAPVALLKNSRRSANSLVR